MKIRNIPFGYRIENGTIHLHPTESQVVREIHAAYLDGQSLLQIAASLNERGVEYMPGAAAMANPGATARARAASAAEARPAIAGMAEGRGAREKVLMPSL